MNGKNQGYCGIPEEQDFLEKRKDSKKTGHFKHSVVVGISGTTLIFDPGSKISNIVEKRPKICKAYFSTNSQKIKTAKSK